VARSWTAPILDLPRRLDELFEEVIFRRWPISANPGATCQPWVPEVDIHELPDGYLVEVNLPGVSADEVQVEFGPRSISVSGQRNEALPAGIVSSLRERSRGPFHRRLELSAVIDMARVEARVSDGLLRILAPKAHGGSQ
jgi:HSP20 family protein